MEGLTTNEAAAVGAIVGVGLTTLILFSLVIYIITVIAYWKIFTKAGEAGWKALIPIYNGYILYKISGVSFWMWLILPIFVASIFSTLATNAEGAAQVICNLIYVALMIAIDVKISISLSKAFGKGNGFAVAMFFFPTICQLILGFGSAKYVGTETK